VARGRLIRIRPGHYTEPGLDEMTARAIHVGGRLACVSELRRRGIWVLDRDELHVHLAGNASRLRSDSTGARLHWTSLHGPADQDHVSLQDALTQASDCLDHREWIAAVDSALPVRQLRPAQLARLSVAVPARRRAALTMVDRRSESGLESIVRVVARELGFSVRSQVQIAGVGRIDLVIEGCIAVETDGSAFHGVSLAAKDRLRDARLVAAGFIVLRPGYSLVVFDRSTLARELIGAVTSHRQVQNSGRIAARAMNRLERLGLA
jgi:very-short-patch-repair endonuclease